MRATVQYTEHSKVFGDDEPQTGTLTIRRYAPGKLQFMIEFTGRDAYTVALRDRTAEVYHPKIDEIQVYDIGKYRDLAQRLMLLGFGMVGRELSANYEVRDFRRETVGAEPATHLELIPKSAEVLAQVRRVELWIADKTDCPVQQKLYFPDGDYKLAQFSSLKVNPVLPASAFDLPKHAKRVRVN